MSIYVNISVYYTVIKDWMGIGFMVELKQDMFYIHWLVAKCPALFPLLKSEHQNVCTEEVANVIYLFAEIASLWVFYFHVKQFLVASYNLVDNFILKRL